VLPAEPSVLPAGEQPPSAVRGLRGGIPELRGGGFPTRAVLAWGTFPRWARCLGSGSGRDRAWRQQPSELARLGERRVQANRAACLPQPEHAAGIPLPAESPRRDAGRAAASAGAQLCRGGAGALRSAGAAGIPWLPPELSGG